MALVDEELTRSVIGSFFTVYNHLGHGYLENVYVGSMMVELQKRNHRVEREVPTAVQYEGVVVGTYRVDLLVEGRLVVEIKAAERISNEQERQLRNYLKCTGLELGLLFCFGLKPQFRRYIQTQEQKGHAVAVSAAVSAESA